MLSDFSRRLLAWFDQHGRHNLPWQHPRDSYRVWLSEIMLQQTQVTTVIPYFQRFLQRFPTLSSLAIAPADDVLKLWAGLGYYARARNLHRAAQIVAAEHGGELPRELDALIALPGIGRSTAGAILAQAHGLPFPILDGNVRRVLARHGAVPGWPGAPAVQSKLWKLSETLLPSERLADYTQALMDLGSQLCTARRPNCAICPVAEDCRAYELGRVADFPAPKPKRDRPQRQSWLLLVTDEEGAVLLERRPPSGLWGGLWCPPVFDAAEDWRTQLLSDYGLVVGEPQPLAPIPHAFTHFDLELLPLRLPLASSPDSAAGTREGRALAWTKLDDLGNLPGLPAPMRKLLESPQLTLIA